jgi:hypothetical protein
VLCVPSVPVAAGRQARGVLVAFLSGSGPRSSASFDSRFLLRERERERANCCGEKNSLDKQMQPRRDHHRRRRLSQQEVEIKEAGGDGG